MAYSRWSHSCWYVFWEGASEPAKANSRAGQQLAIWHQDRGRCTLDYDEALEAHETGEYGLIATLCGFLPDELPETVTLRHCLREFVRSIQMEFPAAPAGAGEGEGGAY